MAQCTQSFHVTNDELNSGLRLDDLIVKNLKVFGQALLNVPFALLTSQNFATGITRAATAFAFSDIATAWGLLKQSSIRNAILDGEYTARIVNSPVFYQPAGTKGADGWKRFG